MSQDHPHRAGFRFTFRHLIILLAYSVAVFKVIIPLVVRVGYMKTGNIVLAVLLVSPALLALLVAFIERAGPLKNWAVSFLIVLFFPAVVLNHDLIVLHAYLKSGKCPTLWATLLVNAVILINSPSYIRKMVPRRCPGCRRRTLVPLMRIFKKDKRASKTCWCASCGGRYWEDREGAWQVERRRTWIDEPKEPAEAEKPVGQEVRPGIVGIPHRPQGGRAETEVRSS